MTKDQLLSKAEKKLFGVHPEIKKRGLMLVERSYNAGIEIMITDAFRSFAEQNKLYAKGRTQEQMKLAGLPNVVAMPKEKKVTNAKGGESYHNYGLAIDFALLDKSGNPFWLVNKDWMKVVEIAKGLGFDWGGDFTTIYDAPHFQINGGKTVKELKYGAVVLMPKLKEEGDKVSVPIWKDDVMAQAVKLGLIDETHKADDVAPKWFVLTVLIKAMNLKK